MLYAQIENDEVVKFPIMEPQLRQLLNNKSLPTQITDESLEGTGYVCVDQWTTLDRPLETLTHSVGLGTPVKTEQGWERTFTLKPVPEDRIEQRREFKLKEVRAKRDILLARADKMLNRYFREERLGLPITIELARIDSYMQALADITNIDDPYAIVWPEL